MSLCTLPYQKRIRPVPNRIHRSSLVQGKYEESEFCQRRSVRNDRCRFHSWTRCHNSCLRWPHAGHFRKTKASQRTILFWLYLCSVLWPYRIWDIFFCTKMPTLWKRLSLDGQPSRLLPILEVQSVYGDPAHRLWNGTLGWAENGRAQNP